MCLRFVGFRFQSLAFRSQTAARLARVRSLSAWAVRISRIVRSIVALLPLEDFARAWSRASLIISRRFASQGFHFALVARYDVFYLLFLLSDSLTLVLPIPAVAGNVEQIPVEVDIVVAYYFREASSIMLAGVRVLRCNFAWRMSCARLPVRDGTAAPCAGGRRASSRL